MTSASSLSAGTSEMLATRGRWADVEDESYIQDLNGKTWRVERASSKRVRLVARPDKQGVVKKIDILRPPDDRPVTILEPTPEEAFYTLQKALGARILASRVEGRYFTPLPETWDLESAVWHMSRFHRVDCSQLQIAEIRQLHETSEPTCPHEHTEAP